VREDCVEARGSKFFRQLLYPIDIPAGPAIFELNISAFNPIERPKSLQQRSNVVCSKWIVRLNSHQNANPLHLVGLLRPRRKRPRCRSAADKPDELAPPHVGPKLRRQHYIGSNEYFDRGQKPASKPLPQCKANVAVGSKADKPSPAKIHFCPLLSKSGQDFSHPAFKVSWSSSVIEECDHARQCQFRGTGIQADILE
jgi:hypothetical protein